MSFPLLIDSCFWIALMDPRDQEHDRARELWPFIEEENVVVPWPALYESLDTRMVRSPVRAEALLRLLKRDTVILHDDVPYREDALLSLETFDAPPRSLTDHVIRITLKDKRLNFQGFITFNHRDFEDVYQERNIPILP